MADQENVLDLLDQAISCEFPHLHGAVNLNRLHEVLSRLASQKCLKSCSAQNSSIPTAIVSPSSEPYQTLSSVQQKSATKGKPMHIANSIVLETNTSVVNAEIADEPPRTVTPSFSHERSLTTLLNETYSQEVFAVSQKLKELQEHLKTVETKVHEIEEVCIKKKSQGHTKEEEIRDCTSKTTVLVHSEAIANVVENTINTVGSQTRTSISSNMMAESEMRFQQSLPQQKATVLRQAKSFETSSTITRFSVETQTDSSKHNGELVDKGTLNAEKGQNAFPAFAELRLIVEALTEREAELYERQTQLERKITSYMEVLNSRLEDKGNDDTASPECQDVKSMASLPFVQDDSIPNLSVFTPSQHPDPHDVAEKRNIGYFITFESEIRSTLVELKKEIRLLEAKMNESNTRHAAGGRLLLEPKHRVKCISCDGLADMNLFTEHVPKPMLLSTNRCLQPFLRNQLNLLQKDKTYWTDTSDILQYR
uniref:Uncharacterized protein n=1 Tax=Anopheles atroparvus TaxID=41427 RepID=A0AAG5DQV5_ANOAO